LVRMSEPANTEAETDDAEGAESTPFNRFFLFCCVLFIYALLSWGAGSLYNDGHEVLAAVLGVVGVLTGWLAVIAVVVLVAPGRARDGGLVKALKYLGFVLAIVGVPAFAWVLTH